MVVAIVALVTAMTGSAAAVSMISGKQIKNGTITGVKVKDSTLDADKLTRKAIRSLRGNKGPRGRVGAAGPAGAAGAQGPIGPRGADGADGQDGIDGQDGADGRDGIDATVSTEPWHVIDRNTVGAAIAQFTVGPFGRTNEANYAATVAPPHGNGSLHLGVNEGDRIAFGTESEFAGLDLDAISALKFWVFVGLDSDPTPRDMPNLSLEVDPGLTSSSYSTLIYVPQTAPKNSWTEIDALSNDTATGYWMATGATGTTLGCSSTNRCSFADVVDRLATAGTGGEISFSLAVTKGRDNAFNGAVDAVQVNDKVYDFEPNGVQVLSTN